MAGFERYADGCVATDVMDPNSPESHVQVEPMASSDLVETAQTNGHSVFFRREMKRAAPWSLLAAGLRQGGSLLSVALIARMLTPSNFGVAAIVISMVGLSVPLVQLGLLQGLVAFDKAPQRLIDSLLWLSIGLSIIVYILLAAISAHIAALYRTPELATLLPAGLLIIVGQNLFGLVTACLQRKLDYRIQSYMAGCIPFFGIAVGVPLALMHLGTWALIVPQIAGNFAGALLGMKLGRLSIQPVFEPRGMRAVLHFSARIMLTNVMMYFSNSGTALVTGRYWNSHAVGLYNFAATNNSRLMDVLASPISPYLFQILSKIGDNKQAMRRSMLEYMSVAQTYLLPVFAILFLTSGPILRIVFGQQWGEAAPYFQALLFVSAAKTMNAGTSTVISVLKHGGIMMASGIARAAMVLIILVSSLVLHASPLNTVVALAASDSLVYLAFVPIGLGLVDSNFADYFRTAQRPLLITVVLAGGMYLSEMGIALILPLTDWLVLGLLLLFALIHLVVVARIYHYGLRDIVRMIRARLRPKAL